MRKLSNATSTITMRAMRRTRVRLNATDSANDPLLPKSRLSFSRPYRTVPSLPKGKYMKSALPRTFFWETGPK